MTRMEMEKEYEDEQKARYQQALDEDRTPSVETPEDDIVYERDIGDAEAAKEEETEKILKTVSSLNEQKTEGLNLLLTPEEDEDKKEDEKEDDSGVTKKNHLIDLI